MDNPYPIISRVMQALNRRHQILLKRFDLLREARDSVKDPDPVLDFIIEWYWEEIRAKEQAGEVIRNIAIKNFKWWDDRAAFFVADGEVLPFTKNVAEAVEVVPEIFPGPKLVKEKEEQGVRKEKP